MKATKKLIPLSDRQAEILLFIDYQIKSDRLDRSPSMKRIGIKFGFSTGNAFRIVDRLREMCCIDGAVGLPGGLELTEAGDRICERLRGK